MRATFDHQLDFWTNDGFMNPVAPVASHIGRLVRRIRSDQVSDLLTPVTHYFTYIGAVLDAGVYTWTGSGFTYDMSQATIATDPLTGDRYAVWAYERIRPFPLLLYRRLYLMPV